VYELIMGLGVVFVESVGLLQKGGETGYARGWG
jgi:hypothetical protein